MCKSNKFVKNLIKLYIKKSYLYTKYGAYNQKNTTIYGVFFVWWAGLDSNQRRRSRRIYSPLHLAALQPSQNGAGERNRTFNLLITSQLLYH